MSLARPTRVKLLDFWRVYSFVGTVESYFLQWFRG